VHSILDFVARHGGPVVFVLVFLDQLGIPMPSVPLLLAVGALSGTGRIEPVTALLAAVGGSLAADLVWYRLGRWKGSSVLAFLCRVSLEPDTCVAKTQGAFARHGVRSLLFAKFVPGYDTVAPPLAGMLGIRTAPFLAWSLAGAVIWVVALGGVGFLFAEKVDVVSEAIDRYANAIGVALVVGLAAYVAWKWRQRREVLRELRMARITPDELHALVVGGGAPVIVDVRHDDAIAAEPFAIPGSLVVTLDEVETRAREIPHERDVILYCT
jgi:membrane protein DedA with SNARE-associated domain